MSEHFDNCWDMTAEEAEAVNASMDRRNPPKIPVRPCPVPPRLQKAAESLMSEVATLARPTLVRSSVYRVYLKTTNKESAELLFSFAPTSWLIESALSQLQEEIPQPFDKNEEDERDSRIAKYEHLIALVRLVPVLRLPKSGCQEDHDLLVAGVNIGYVNIKALHSWDFAEGP